MSTSSLKPLTVHGKAGPNPPKVAMLLKELSIPFEYGPTGFPDVKKPEYLALNPNGRLPTLIDPNTGITIWESGAIMEYLIETYDKDHSLSFPAGSKEYYAAKQWLFFQASGQGPYFGQYVWFLKHHPEEVKSAKERYLGEIKRVAGVVEGHLEKEGDWLVGGKYSYVDLAWLMWFNVVEKFTGDKEVLDMGQWPKVQAWVKRIAERPVVKEVLEGLPH
jgi:glutathione S-transferase